MASSCLRFVAGALAFAASAAAAWAQDPPTPAPSAPTSSPATSPDGGKATIRCVVADKARLEDCVVVSEEPVGGGFGAMALDMSKEMRFRGPGAEGGVVTIPVTFKAPVGKGTRR